MSILKKKRFQLHCRTRILVFLIMGFSVEALLLCAPSLFTDCVGASYDTRYPLILTPPSLNSSHPFPALILLHLLCRDDAGSDEDRSDWSMKAQMKEPSGSGGTHPHPLTPCTALPKYHRLHKHLFEGSRLHLKSNFISSS